MKLILAPMEGVVDFHMRELLSKIGGFDLCVTEFVRVVNVLLPPRVFYRYCPELHNGGMTKYGTPVRVQLLGQHAEILAENAVRAVELGSHGVDLNFGCPAKTVNKSKGGAVLLKDPEQIFKIVKSVRDAVDQKHSVSAKVRLGFDDTSNSQEIFDAVEQAGASSIAIHARTKRDGYRPPAYWEKIKPLKAKSNMEVVANGEIWNFDHYQACRDRSDCEHIMLGRGALAKPDLAFEISQRRSNKAYHPLKWQNILEHIIDSSMHCDGSNSEIYFASRTKQWLSYLKIEYPEAEQFFESIKRLKGTQEVLDSILKVTQ
jgi:tRNA-dihydrouridine synthase C